MLKRNAANIVEFRLSGGRIAGFGRASAAADHHRRQVRPGAHNPMMHLADEHDRDRVWGAESRIADDQAACRECWPVQRLSTCRTAA